MVCPKCKSKIGVMKHEVIVDTGLIVVARCIICGYWATPHNNSSTSRPSYKAEL